VSGKQRELLIVGGLGLSAFALRMMWALHTHAPTIDTSIVALMAMDIQAGARPLFFAGQGYMGALEAYFTALVFALAGPGRVSMCVVPALSATVWVLLIYALLRRFLPRPPAAAGALTLVLPAEHVLWYSAFPYGGYPEMFALGTAVLLHAVCRLQAPDRLRPLRDASLLALLAGLAAWTNLQALPFLATAGVLWLFILLPHRQHPSRWLPFALFPSALLLAILPQILLSRQNPASPPLFEGVDPTRLLRGLRHIFRRDLIRLFDWPHAAGLSARLSAAPLLFPTLFGVLQLHRQRILAGILALFSLFFLLLYLPHPLAGTAPRYLIVWADTLCAVLTGLALHAPRLRTVSLPLLLIWLGMQGFGFVSSMRARQPGMLASQAGREEIVQTARALGFDAVRIVGSDVEGHQGSVFSLHALNDPVFSSSYDDRRHTAQLAWTRAQNPGYLFPHGYEPFIRGSLAELELPVPEIHRAGGMRLMAVPRPRPGGERILPSEEMSLELSSDRVSIRFPAPRRVHGLRLTAEREADMPYRYRLEGVLPDGARVPLRHSEQRLASTRIIGDRVIFKGYEAWMDIRFPESELIGLELIAESGSANPTPPRLRDALVFEPAEQPPLPYGEINPLPYNPRVPRTWFLPPY